MPYDNLQLLPAQSLERISQIATSKKRSYSKILLSQEGKALMTEIEIDYCRAINKQIFDAEMQNPNKRSSLYSDLQLPPPTIDLSISQ